MLQCENEDFKVFFNLKNMYSLFTKISRISFPDDEKIKIKELCMEEKHPFKKLDTFINFRGVRRLISKSKERNLKEIEEFFIEEFYRIKFTNQTNTNIFDFIDTSSIENLPIFNETYTTCLNITIPKNPKQSSKTKPNTPRKKEKECENAVPEDDLEKDVEDVISEKDFDDLEKDVEDVISEKDFDDLEKDFDDLEKDFDDLEKDVEEIAIVESKNNCYENDENDDEICVLITKTNKKYTIRNVTMNNFDSILEKGYKIVLKSKQDLSEVMLDIINKISADYGRELCCHDGPRDFKIRNPLREDTLLGYIQNYLANH